MIEGNCLWIYPMVTFRLILMKVGDLDDSQLFPTHPKIRGTEGLISVHPILSFLPSYKTEEKKKCSVIIVTYVRKCMILPSL